MAEKTIRADEVKDGQTITSIAAKGHTRWRKRPTVVDQDIRKARGRWPTVINASFLEDGEDGQPTVYLELSDKRGWTFPLAPDDQVTIEEGRP